jgi:hypothetical protein
VGTEVETRKRFDVSNIGPVWHEAKQKNDQKLQLEKWLTQFRSMVKRQFGRDVDFYDGATLVGSTAVTQKLKVKDLAEDHPDIAKKYTRLVTEQKFDEEAFRADHPALAAQYLTETFNFK